MTFKKQKTVKSPFAAVGLTALIFSLTAIGAWLTSIIHCISNEKYILLIADVLFGPIGVIHGVGLWLGANW